jgi:hypothetical protein
VPAILAASSAARAACSRSSRAATSTPR